MTWCLRSGVALGLALCGCGDDATRADQLGAVPIGESRQAVLTEFTDGKGRRWILRSSTPVQYASNEPESSEARTRESANPPEAQTDPAVLAEMMRPILVLNGYEYWLATPDLALAQRMIAEKNTDHVLPEGQGQAGTAGPAERIARSALMSADMYETAEGSPEASTDSIINSDNREQRRDNTQKPMRRLVVLFTGGSLTKKCTASMIGPSTAVTAAHCVVTPSGVGIPLWSSPRTWGLGADSQDPVPFPYRPGGAYPSSINTPVSPNFCGTSQSVIANVPNCYFGGVWGDDDCDFAVLEFSNMYPGVCGLFPGNTVGWYGFAHKTDAYIMSNNIFVYGYPGFSATCQGGSCNWPQIWGMGKDNPSDVDSAWIDYTVDTNGGQSGAGAYSKDAAGVRRVLGIHKASDGINENYARRVTSYVFNYVSSYSAL